MLLERSCFIFDLDGTLIDSLGVWSQVDMELVSRLTGGRVSITEDDACALRTNAMRLYGEGSESYVKYMADLKRLYGLPGTPEAIHHDRYELAQEFLRDRVRYRDGAAELIRRLHELGRPMAIATTTRRRNIEVYARRNASMIAEAPLEDFFEMIVTRDDVARVKPDPEAFLRILDALGADPAECLVIEDALPGMLGARAAGIDSVVITERHNDMPREELDRAALARFESPRAMLEALEAEIAARG